MFTQKGNERRGGKTAVRMLCFTCNAVATRCIDPLPSVRAELDARRNEERMVVMALKYEADVTP